MHQDLQQRILGLSFLFAFYLFGLLLVRVTNLPVPGSIAGLLALVGLLALRKGRAPSVRAGTNLLLPLIPLFLIPICVSMVVTVPLNRSDSWKLVAMISLSTVIGVILTSVAAKLLVRARPEEE